MADVPPENESKQGSNGLSFGVLRLIGFGFLAVVLGLAYYLDQIGRSRSVMLLAGLGIIGIAWTAYVLSNN